MVKTHRTGLVFCAAGVLTVFTGFWTAGTTGAIEFSSRYFWAFVILPLALAAAVTGLSWKWPIIGGCTGVMTPFLFFFTLGMDTLYRYLYTAAIVLFFIGGILLLITAVRKKP